MVSKNPQGKLFVVSNRFMFQLMSFVASSLIIASLLFSGRGFAAARLESLTVGYSNFTGTYGPLWIAVEERVGTKYGLDLKAIYAGRVRPQQLLATGEMPIVLASATGTMTSHIVGVKDQVLVATITSKIGTSIFSKSEIKSVEELKGKTVATGRPGAFLDATVRYVLRSKFGPAGGEERVGNAVVAISSGEANRRDLDHRAIDHEKDRGERIRQSTL